MPDVFDLAPKQIVFLYMCFRILSDFVSCLKEPTPQSSEIYQVFYKFINLLLGDSKSFMNAIVTAKVPHLLPGITPTAATAAVPTVSVSTTVSPAPAGTVPATSSTVQG